MVKSAASLSIHIIILFSVVSSHRSPLIKLRRHISHVKVKISCKITFCINLSSAVRVIHGHAGVLDPVPLPSVLQ